GRSCKSYNLPLYRLSDLIGFSVSYRSSNEKGFFQASVWRIENICKDGGKRHRPATIILSELRNTNLFHDSWRRPESSLPSSAYRSSRRSIYPKIAILVSFSTALGQRYRLDTSDRKTTRFPPQRRCWRQFVNVRYWPIADIPFCAAQGVLAIADEIID